MSVCQHCGVELPPRKPHGQPRKWCSNRCRKRAVHGGVCVDCGRSLLWDAKRCQACDAKLAPSRSRQRWAPHRARVEALWALGLTQREIREVTGRVLNISMLRAKGYDLPYRRSPETRARIPAGNAETMAHARAARKPRERAA